MEVHALSFRFCITALPYRCLPVQYPAAPLDNRYLRTEPAECLSHLDEIGPAPRTPWTLEGGQDKDVPVVRYGVRSIPLSSGQQVMSRRNDPCLGSDLLSVRLTVCSSSIRMANMTFVPRLQNRSTESCCWIVSMTDRMRPERL